MPPGGGCFLAAVDQSIEECPCGEDQSCGGNLTAILQPHAGHPAMRDNQVSGLAFDDPQAGKGSHFRLHGGTVERSVCLRAWSADGRTLPSVKDPELDSGLVGDSAHQAIECVHLADQVALPEPADRRIAGHLADGREPMREQNRVGTESGGRGCGFCARMASSDNDNVGPRIHGFLFHVKQP